MGAYPLLGTGKGQNTGTKYGIKNGSRNLGLPNRCVPDPSPDGPRDLDPTSGSGLQFLTPFRQEL